MIPLIYVAATLPLFITSIVFTFVHLFMPSMVNVTVSTAITSLSMLYVVAVILASLFPAIRNTYGDRVAQVILSFSVFLLEIGSTTYNPWNWVLVAIWGALFVFNVLFLRAFQRVALMTPKEKYSLDSFSRRVSYYPR